MKKENESIFFINVIVPGWIGINVYPTGYIYFNLFLDGMLISSS